MRSAAFATAMTAAAVVFTAGAFAQTPVAGAGRADVAIMTARQIAHTATEPLLLRVHLFNGAARQAAMRNVTNERQAADAALSPRFQKLSAGERARLLLPLAPRPVPAIQLGSPDRALASHVRFTVEAGHGKPVALVVRPLAGAAWQRGAVRLDDRRSVMLPFGIDAAAFAAIPAGTYTIRAHVDTTAERDMWRGRTTSQRVVMTLGPRPAATPQTRLERLARAGAFNLADERFAAAEASARGIIAADGAVVDAWVLLGDALDGAGRRPEALDAFRKALSLFNARRPVPGVTQEPPVYIQERLVEIETALRRR